MTRTVMVPLDGTAFAEQALPWALALARVTDSRVHLVHVRPSLPLLADPETENYLHRTAVLLETQLPGHISTALLTYEIGTLQVAVPAPAEVAAALLEHASAQGVSTIIMTTHGRGPVRRAFLGSVATSVLRESDHPVLLIRPHDMAFSIAANADRGIKHILIPLDGSPAAETVLPYAREIGAPFGARYTLVGVSSPRPWALSAEAGAYMPVLYPVPYDHTAAERYLDTIAEPMRAQNMDVTTRMLDEWPPDKAITDYVAAHAVDLIAMTTAAGAGFGRLLVGSVADRVIRAADAPVLCCNSVRIAATAATRGQAAEIAESYLPLS